MPKRNFKAQLIDYLINQLKKSKSLCENILLKTLAYVRDIDGLTLYFDFPCFTSLLLIRDENQFWAIITKPLPAETTKPQSGYGFYEEC